MKEPASNLKCEVVLRVRIYTTHSALPLVLTFGLTFLAGCAGGSASPPQITMQPANQTVVAGQSTTFSVVANGTSPLTYQWQKNQLNIAGATSASYTTPATTSADNGTSFQVVVTNPVSSVTSNSATLTVMAAAPTASVLTQHNDNARTGQNTSETILNTSNVNTSKFGKLFSMPADGQVYAQPLYVLGVTINGGVHNVVILATENDSVYAYDADSSGAPLWKASLVDAAHAAGAGETPLNSATTIACTDLQPQIGITSTPVIDPTSKTIYVEAKSTDGLNYFHRLHALDLLTGNEKTPGPVVIAGTVRGTGDGSSNGQLVFNSNNNALHELNRPGLLLLNGTIYIAYASHCDSSPWHGWLFAYDAATFTQKSVYVTTPNGGMGGFWMSGAGVAADASGNIFIASGNGDFDTTNVPATETGDTILKLGTTNQNLALLDYFTPQDQANLNSSNIDLGSGGVLLVPDQSGSFPHILVQAGKEGRIYVVNRDQMTTNNSHYCSGCPNDPEIIEESGSGAVGVSGQLGGMFNIAAYWNNTLYFWGVNDVLKSIPITNGLPDFTHVSGSTPQIGFPAAGVSVSSNGTMTETGIVWAIDGTQYGSPGPGPGPAVLYAYDATNVPTMLYSSAQNATRDAAGNAVKFAVPTIANGKVYVGTSTEVDVYGLIGANPLPNISSITPSSVTAGGPAFPLTVNGTGYISGATVNFGSNPAITPSSVTGTQIVATIPAADIATAGAVNVTVTNPAAGGTSNAQTFTINNPAPTAPAITSANNTTFTVGTAGSFAVTATGSPTPSLSESGPLPNPVTFKDNGNGTATIAGTPASGTAGTYSITITASNGVGTAATQTFTLTVNQAPAITSANSTTFTVGSAGSFTVTTTGSPTPSLTKSGTLPSAVTFTNNGNGTATIAGTPASGTAGTYSITITASNGVGTAATQTFTLTVTSGGGGTLSQVQSVTCTVTSTGTCSFSTTVAASNAYLFSCSIPTTSQPVAGQITTVTSNGTSVGTVIPTPSTFLVGYPDGTGRQMLRAYVLPSTAVGGSTNPIILTMSPVNTPTLGHCLLAEYHPSANPSQVGVDIDTAVMPQVAAANLSDLAVTLSGTGNEGIVKDFQSGSNDVIPTAVSSPYNTNFSAGGSNSDSAVSSALTSSGAAATWTNTSVVATLGTLALGYNTTSCTEQTFINFSGSGATSGNTPTQTDLSASIQGFNGWYIGTFSIGSLVYNTAARMPLLNTVSRLCDGSTATSGAGTNGVSLTWSGSPSQQGMFTLETPASVIPVLNTSFWFNETFAANDESIYYPFQIYGTTDNTVVEVTGTGTTRELVFDTEEGTVGAIAFTAATQCPCRIATTYAVGNGTTGGTHTLKMYDKTNTQIGSTISHVGLATIDYPKIMFFGLDAGSTMTVGKITHLDSLQISLTGAVPGG